MTTNELGLPVSIAEKMTEQVFTAFMEMFPKEELQTRITETIEKFFNGQIYEDKVNQTTRFEKLVFDALSTQIKPVIQKLLCGKEEAFKEMMAKQFFDELKQVTNQGTDNIVGLLALSSSRIMASEIIQQVHQSAIMAVRSATTSSQYGGSFAAQLDNYMSGLELYASLETPTQRQLIDHKEKITPSGLFFLLLNFLTDPTTRKEATHGHATQEKKHDSRSHSLAYRRPRHDHRHVHR